MRWNNIITIVILAIATNCIKRSSASECQCSPGTYCYQEIPGTSNELPICFPGKKCDCQGLEFQELPSFFNPEEIISINLSDNKLSNISRWHLEKFISLRSMDISGNPIKEIGSKSFLNSAEMVELKLSADSLKYNSLRGMRSLRKLSIDGNGRLAEIPSRVMSHLQSLEHLIISNTAITSLPPSFMENYQHLKIVDMRQNNLNSVDSGAFNNTPKLLELHLAHNNIKKIHHSIVKHASKLRVFDISHNNLTSIDEDFLSNTRELNHLDLSSNELSSIVIKTNILNLDLSSNNFTDTNNIRFSNTSWVQFLNLANNSLNSVSKFYTIAEPDVLPEYASKQQKIDISYNHIQHIDPDAFTSFYQLKKLDLEGNQLTTNNNGFNQLKLPVSMRRLHLASNLFIKIPDIVQNFKYLRWLDLSNNQIDEITEGIFTGFKDFQYLNLNGNQLTIFPDDFLMNSTISEVLDLSGNELSCSCRLKIGLARTSKDARILGQCQSMDGFQMLSLIQPKPGLGLISPECNFCSLNPCLHGGTCLNNTDHTVCMCAPGFSGLACQIVPITTTATTKTTTTTTTTKPTIPTTTKTPITTITTKIATTPTPTPKTTPPPSSPSTQKTTTTTTQATTTTTTTTTQRNAKFSGSEKEKTDNESTKRKLTTSIVFNIGLAILVLVLIVLLLVLYRKYRIVFKLNQYHTKKDTIQMEQPNGV